MPSFFGREMLAFPVRVNWGGRYKNGYAGLCNMVSAWKDQNFRRLEKNLPTEL